MPTFIMLSTLGPDGAATLRDNPDRIRAVTAEVEAMGVKVVEGVDKSGFISVATPMQDQIAQQLGPNAVKILTLARALKYRDELGRVLIRIIHRAQNLSRKPERSSVT